MTDNEERHTAKKHRDLLTASYASGYLAAMRNTTENLSSIFVEGNSEDFPEIRQRILKIQSDIHRSLDEYENICKQSTAKQLKETGLFE